MRKDILNVPNDIIYLIILLCLYLAFHTVVEYIYFLFIWRERCPLLTVKKISIVSFNIIYLNTNTIHHHKFTVINKR